MVQHGSSTIYYQDELAIIQRNVGKLQERSQTNGEGTQVMKDLEEILSDIEWNLAERLFNPTRCKTLKVRRKKLENEWRKLWAKGKLLFVSAGIWNTLTFHCFLHRLSYQNSFQRLTAALLCHIFSHVLFFFSVFIFFLV